VQRRTGCSFTCQKLSRAILGAAKGSRAALVPAPRTFTVPSSILKKELEQETKAKEEDIENALDLIKQEKYDVQMLGMSAFVNITANNNISIDESNLDFLSNYILSQQYFYGRGNDIQSKVYLDALTLLANLLTHKSIQAQFVIEKGILKTLITELVNVNLNVSYQAARCLTAICRFYPTLKSNIASFGANTVIDQASEECLARHKLLESEIQQLKLLSNF